jgi:hypothetical protein
VGVISPYKVALSERGETTMLVMVFTNIGLHPVANITLEYVYSNDVALFARHTHAPKSLTTFPGELRNNEQVK